jgi:hypothetical protein
MIQLFYVANTDTTPKGATIKTFTREVKCADIPSFVDLKTFLTMLKEYENWDGFDKWFGKSNEVIENTIVRLINQEKIDVWKNIK